MQGKNRFIFSVEILVMVSFDLLTFVSLEYLCFIYVLLFLSAQISFH